MNKLVLILLAGVVFSQRANAQWTILYRSQDLVSGPDTASQISSIKSRGALSKYLIVRYIHARKQLIAKKAIWGYIDDRKAIWRSYDKELFCMIQYNGAWVEYVVNRLRGTRLTSNYMAVMYSRTLDSKIKSNWAEAMADAPPKHIVR